jgi:hypothetical protein
MVSPSEQCRKENKDHSRSIKPAMSSQPDWKWEDSSFPTELLKAGTKSLPSLKSEKTMKSFKNDYAHLRANMVGNT